MTMLDILRGQYADQYQAKRDAAVAAIEAVASTMTDETRTAATADEDTALTEALSTIAAIDSEDSDNEAHKLRSRIDELEKVEARSTNARRAPVAGINKPDEVRDVARLSNDEARARAVSWIETSRRFVRDSHKQTLTNLIETQGTVGAAAARMALHTGSEAYQRGWSKYMSGDHFGMTEEERQALSLGKDTSGEVASFGSEARAGMTSGTGGSGGYLVPVFIDPTMIITGAGSTNPFRHISTVKTIAPAFGGWYGATGAQVTAAWTTEGSAAPDNTPTITQVNIPVYMAEAFVQVSYQAFEDISDLAGDVQMLFADAKANLEAIAHATSTGSGSPTGVSYAVGAVTASRVAPATGGAVAVADVFTVQNALPERFQNFDWGSAAGSSLAWAASMTVANKVRALAMAQNSANSVWTDIAGGVPPLLAGNSVYRAGSMSSSLTTGQDVLLYGDFTKYYIIDRIGFTTEFIPNLFDTSTGRPVAQRGWMSHWRTGANVVDANAFRQLRL